MFHLICPLSLLYLFSLLFHTHHGGGVDEGHQRRVLLYGSCHSASCRFGTQLLDGLLAAIRLGDFADYWKDWRGYVVMD